MQQYCSNHSVGELVSSPDNEMSLASIQPNNQNHMLSIYYQAKTLQLNNRSRCHKLRNWQCYKTFLESLGLCQLHSYDFNSRH